jgi:hypothetical protein
LLDLGPLVITAGVLVAVLTFALTQRRDRSEDFLEAAIKLLEQAYDVLSAHGESQPPNDRRIWLSAARLLRTSEAIGEKVTENSHRLIYDATREYWRSRFYDLINPSREGFPSTYYADVPEHMLGYVGNVRAPLSEKSLTVLYRFIRWPEGRPDPIGEEAPFTSNEIEKMRAFGPRGLGEVLARVRELSSRPSTRDAA